MNKQTFKIVLVGDGGVGKTAYINRLRTGDFEKKYNPTIGLEVAPLHLRTNKGDLILNIWDCAGQSRGLAPADYTCGVDGAIIMFDVGSCASYKNVDFWRAKIPVHIPIVLCGNKCDVKERRVRPSEIDTDLEYYDISAKSNYNFEKPFLYLVKSLLGDDTVFVEN